MKRKLSIRLQGTIEQIPLRELKRAEEIFARLIAYAESDGLHNRYCSSVLREGTREGSSAGSEDGINLQGIKQLPASEDSNSGIIGTEENSG